MINPMRTGSGLRNKVLEAFGLGTAVVSTARGVEALPAARDGEHLVIAGDGARFADAVLGLLDDPVRRLRLRANANALLHERYRWSVVGRPWGTLFGADGSVARRQSHVDFLGA
jgi:glycosyltransferase involved in cell wall biosynthesis